MQNTEQNGVSDSPQFLAARALPPTMPHDYISLSPPTGYHSHSHQGHHALLPHHVSRHLQAQQQQQHYYARHSEDMAAAALPSGDQMTEARVGGHLLDHHPMATSEAVSTVREAPAVYRQRHHEEGDFLQTGGSSNPWWDQVRGSGDTCKAHSEPGGAVQEGYEPEERIGGVELNVGISEDTARRHEYQEDSGDIFVGNDGRRELLTFPEGEDDAVTITASDLEGLHSARFLSNNVIDFYIRHLERRLSSELRNQFYFFNSFFFTKLLGNSNASKDIDECEVGYNQVRRWTGEVNLFEKD